MHIPENYLSPATCGVMGAVMLPIWAVAIKKTGESLTREKMPLLGVAAAFCFLAMMFNVPMPGGSTGHAVCGTLMAILFGPWPAVLAVSVALILQAIFFGDGGILAIGANCFNMAFVLPFVGYGIYYFIKEHVSGLKGELVGAAIGSYIALNVAALFAALEFGVQPLLFTDAAGNALYCPYPVSVSVPAMLIGHLTVWGIVEAIFTVGILAFIRKTSPQFGVQGDTSKTSMGKIIAPVAGLIGVLIVATPLGLLAEGDAWGEWGVEDIADMVGYTPAGMEGWEWSALLPDYSMAGLPDVAGYILSAVIGVALLVIIFRLAAFALKPSVDFEKRA